MNEELKKVYKETVMQYAPLEQRVEQLRQTIELKAKQAKKFEKSDPEMSRDLDSFLSGMRLAYQILRAKKKDGWKM